MSTNNWDRYERAADKGPMALFWKIFGLVIAISVITGVVGYGLGWFSEAGQVVQEQFGARAALQKYEWFIDQSNRIDKMDQDIKLFENRTVAIDDQYAAYGKDRAKWAPDIRLQYNREKQQGREDLLAVVSQRNNLVRDYNAASEKFNWAPFQTKPDKPRERINEYVTQ
ncbi:MAG: hypothetical protein UT43_C0047G0002 [Parcubacteria group bacterium GW2011_GWC1_39_29]|nr:MAG: hypothetical protein UT43_C0047G0002 [Parcubacteria group bacterium GW2011_GWC1_39_29]